MKNKFALCFRPVDIEKEEKDRDRNNHIDDHHLDSKGSRRSFSCSDIKDTDPSSRHDLRRRNSSSRKNLSAALKTLFRSSPKVVPKATGAQEGDHMGIEKNKEKVANNPKTNIIFSNSCSSSSSTSHVTSPSSSTSSSMNSSEMNNINEFSLKRSNSSSIYQNKKPKTTKGKDNKALKSSQDQEGFVFYLVILALVFNLLCGLVYAIMLTSLSLYFIGRHRMQRPVNSLKLAELRKSKRKTMLHV